MKKVQSLIQAGHRAREQNHPVWATGHVIWRIAQKQSDLNLGLIAAGIAFYGLLSLFPGITAAVAVAGVFMQPDMLVENTGEITVMLPDAAERIVMGQLRSVAQADDSTLSFAASLALAIALYSASRAVANFIAGLNVIHGKRETRNFFVVRALTILLTLVMIVGLVIAVVLIAVFPIIAALFAPFGWVDDVIMLLRWPALYFMGVLGISLLYKFGPAKGRRALRWITPGALVACALWVLGSYGFSSYVQSFGSYNETFGALGGVIILLTWLWLSAFIVLIGALLDAELGTRTVNSDDDIPDPGPTKPE